MNLDDKRIAIIGLGYVGLPLAIEFGKKYKVLGMNPFVAIGISLVVIIGTSIAVTKIKAG